MITSLDRGSAVRVNRHLRGWSGAVAVKADGYSLEQLRATKRKALEIAFELTADIEARVAAVRQKDDQEETEIVRF